ncbi:MAG: MFS transporter [Solobacterium sp.]|nr:MFS transporter [Solobacterium sp.]
MKSRSIKKLLFLTVCYFLAANFAHPVEPTFYKNLAMPDYMFGLAFAAMATFNFLFSPFWGKIADQYGPNKVLGISFLFYAVGQVMFFLAKSVSDLIIARCFAGIFISGVTVGEILYIIENTNEEERGKYLATYATISAIFSAFGYMIGGIIGDMNISFSFYAQIIGLALTGILHFLILEDRPRETVSLKARQLLKESNPFQAFLDARSLMSKPFLYFLMICMFTAFATNCYDQCFNYFIKDVYGFPPSYNGWLKGAIGIITLIANSTICAYLLSHTKIERSLVKVLVVCLGMMIGIILIDAIVPFIILNVIFFAFNAVYKPLLQTMINWFNKDKQSGTVVGVYNSVSSLGTILGSLVAGFVYSSGPKLSFVYAAIAFVIAIVFSFLQMKHREGTV